MFVLWGSHPRYCAGEPIKLTAGTLGECRSAERTRRADGGWKLAIYRAGTTPVGLRELARKA
jgi:hypothetical protein